ncbi:AraC family transcriptional regulator [Novosphingobium sp. KCTC 2891]|uniref:AraC family transcriptional regulator n=1 Tax=Novosphingobium sp. KCTC 2891 TaxID=2989730 RepID=UPI002222D0C5|nr:AraC family transcriptional regulator [Novosphingobium sp. KCTC 2891]MCW1384870.1 AraC family transcriptional regulator [Novosphingobium sp. KCTC 2891]
MERLFSTANSQSSEEVSAYAALMKREFYEGDLECPDGTFDVTFDKAMSNPIAITRITSGCDLSFRRGPKHIRNNRVGIRVLWFVRKGSLKIRRADGTCEIGAGFAGIMDSSVPFHATLKRNGEDRHESTQIILPPDFFFAHLIEAEKLSAPVDLQSSEGAACTRLLDILLEYGDTLGEQSSRHLVGGLLEAIADHLRNSFATLPKRQNLVDRRLADIENYIMMNLTDPDLCHDKVAANCGISPRYLCYLLKANNTSFSDLVWKNRLPKARDWLVTPKTRNQPIHEIAYMSGFKSAAHFSRMFKTAYGVTPREFRAMQTADSAPANSAVHEMAAHYYPQQLHAA